MALPQTETEVFAFFSPLLRLSIENLISEGRILLNGDSASGGSLDAQVAGNRPRPYVVSIAMDAAASLDTSFCDCQGTLPCIHIAATWISKLRKQAGKRSGLEFSQLIQDRFALESPELSPPQSLNAPALSSSVDLRSNPLDFPAPAAQPIALPKNLVRPSAEQADFQLELTRIVAPSPPKSEAEPLLGNGTTNGERWRLGFLLDSLQIPVVRPSGQTAGFRRVHAVKPCLVYVRRDELDGRLRDYEPHLLTESATEDELAWRDILLSQGGMMELDRIMLLGELADTPRLPRIRGSSGAVLSFLTADTVEVRFRPHALPWGTREIDFKAELRVQCQTESFLARSFECGLRRIFFVGDGGKIASLPTTNRMAALLELVGSRRMQLDMSEIQQVQAGLAASPIPQLTVSLNGQTVLRRLCRGQAVVSLEAAAEGLWTNSKRATYLRVEIDWDFAETEPEKPPEPDWTRLVGINPEDSSAILWVRDFDWEGEVINWLRIELGSLLATKDEPVIDDLSRLPPTRIDGKFHAMPDSGGLIGLARNLDEIRSFRLNIELNQFLRDWGAHLMDCGFTLKLRRDAAPSTRGSVNIQFDNGMDWLDIEAQIATFSRGKGTPGARKRAARQARNQALTAERKIELTAIQDLLTHRIARGSEGLILLSPEDATKLQRLLDLGLTPGSKHRIAHGDIGTLAALPIPESAHIREIARARELVEKLVNLDPHTLESPEPSFAATLRGYQRRGFSWLLHMHESGLGACLADDMGLGKTVQALAFLQKLAARDPGIFKALLIAPVSTLPNWAGETSRFTPDVRIYLHHGDLRSNATPEDFTAKVDQVDLCLVSFATLRNDLPLFSSREWSVVLVDEAQTIKNPESATFAAIQTLKARQRISLTGTPVENSVRDLWAQMDFINPGMLGSLKRFTSRYGTSIEERHDSQAVLSLRQVVAPFVLRRRKEEVARDLPPKEEILLFCDLGPAQRKIYEDIKEAFRLKIDQAIKSNGVSRSAMTILEALLRLRQACLFPDLIHPDWLEAGSAKGDLLADIMAELAAEDHKALIFSQFTEVLDRIGGNLTRDRRDFVRLDGQTTNRAAPVARFQEDAACRLFLISLKAGGVGINLTAADYVILFDPWWNPAVENQAIDRAHRIGRNKPVIVYRLIARDTVEEKMLTLQQRKRELAGALTDNDESVLGKLNPNELMELLG